MGRPSLARAARLRSPRPGVVLYLVHGEMRDLNP